MKKVFLLLACIISFPCFANFIPINTQTAVINSCPSATPTTDNNFCTSFKAAAECNCELRSPSKKLCQNVKQIYKLMIGYYGSLERACALQHNTTAQVCIDGWNCYLNGGRDSTGGLCNATGNVCE